MFRQRLITSLVLAPSLLALLFWAPGIVLYTLFFIVLLVGAYEWHKLIPLETAFSNAFFLVVYVSSILAVSYYQLHWIKFFIGIWLPIMAFIMIYPRGTSLWAARPITFVSALLVTCLFTFSMQGIYNFQLGKALIIFLLFVVWAADIGAYTFGKLWGSHKLIPNVSPGKSWEGFFGGIAFVTIIAVLGALYFAPISILRWFLLIYCCFILSIFGDLFISMLKRNCKLKDTGHILPGHGGVLDRLDSLISSAPLFYVGLSYLNLGIY